MKALIIDDNRPLAESLKKLLEKEGLKVSVGRSWAEVSDLAEKEPFPFYLIDIFLPGKQGIEILKEIRRRSPAGGFKAVLMSGFFNEPAILKEIPEDLKPFCVFMRKPIDEGKLLNQLKAWRLRKEEKDGAEKRKSYSPSFHLDMSESLVAYLSKRETFEGPEMMIIIFLAHYSKFTGALEVFPEEREKTRVEFHGGQITKTLSENKQSYFGALLVEHGLLLNEDIQFIFDGKATDERIGQTLLEKKLLSPYMLEFILKEQIKIRLSRIISQKSFSVNVFEELPPDAQPEEMSHFNWTDTAEWSIDSIQTQLSDFFLKTFFLANKNCLLRKNKEISVFFPAGGNFLKEYNDFFHSIENNISFKEILENSKGKKQAQRMVYFGVLTKSLDFIRPSRLEMSVEDLEFFVSRILGEKKDSPYKTLNIPWQSSLEEVEIGYRKIIKAIHPDNLSESLDKSMREKCSQAFHKANSAYRLLSDKDKKQEWLKAKKERDFLEVVSVYEKGIRAVKTGQYAEGLERLRSIEKNTHAPGNTALYIIWAKIKSQPDLMSNRAAAGKILKQINACSIDQRVSPLFWFINGLYYQATGHYDRALSLFKKTLRAQKDFPGAKKCLMLTEKKLKEGKKTGSSFFSQMFQKKPQL